MVICGERIPLSLTSGLDLHVYVRIAYQTCVVMLVEATRAFCPTTFYHVISKSFKDCHYYPMTQNASVYRDTQCLLQNVLCVVWTHTIQTAADSLSCEPFVLRK